jgi:hypothetical protein
MQEDAVLIKEMGKPTPAIVQLVKLLQGGDAGLVASVAALALEAGLLPASLQHLLVGPPLLTAMLLRSGLPAALLPGSAPGPQMIAPDFVVY